jgi:hypothetical protein
VRVTQSGTSIDKPGRLSKSGNAYLRSAMFMPAMSAIRESPNKSRVCENRLTT